MSRKKADEGYRSKTDRVNSSRAGRRKKKQRREALLVAGVLVFVLVVAVLSISAFMKVAFIQVENVNGRYTDDEIIAASGLKNGDSLMRIGKKAVNDKICLALPYVGEAKVKISIPDTVLISVSYTEATMCIHTVNGYVLLDNTCKVLQTDVSALSDYVAILKGVELVSAVPGHKAEFSDPDMATYVVNLAADFAKYGFYNVTAYDFSDILNVKAEIDYRVVVRLGNISKAESRLKFGKAVIDKTLQDVHLTGTRQLVDLTIDKTAYVDAIDEDGSIIHATTGVRIETETDEDLSSVEPSYEEEEGEEPAGRYEDEDEDGDGEDYEDEDADRAYEEEAGAPDEDGEDGDGEED